MKQFDALTRKKDNQAARYLIVDDSVFARKSLAKMVESFGGQVAGEAGDGCTAITEYARTNPDIVLMDITMPQMEGIEAVERIVQEHPDARIVMVSSVGYQDNILAALQKVGQDHRATGMLLLLGKKIQCQREGSKVRAVTIVDDGAVVDAPLQFQAHGDGRELQQLCGDLLPRAIEP